METEKSNWGTVVYPGKELHGTPCNWESHRRKGEDNVGKEVSYGGGTTFVKSFSVCDSGRSEVTSLELYLMCHRISPQSGPRADGPYVYPLCGSLGRVTGVRTLYD